MIDDWRLKEPNKPRFMTADRRLKISNCNWVFFDQQSTISNYAEIVKRLSTCHCEELAAQALAQRVERRSNLTKRNINPTTGIETVKRRNGDNDFSPVRS
jgi:hypothetical protein